LEVILPLKGSPFHNPKKVTERIAVEQHFLPATAVQKGRHTKVAGGGTLFREDFVSRSPMQICLWKF